MQTPQTDHRPILVHHTGSLGDTLASVPGLRAIRANFPAAQIHLLFDVQGDTRALAMDIIRPLGLADEYIPYDSSKTFRGQLGTYFLLWKKLRTRSYSQVISLLPSSRPRLSLWRHRAFYGLSGIWNSASFRPVQLPANSPIKEAQRKLLRLAAIGLDVACTGTYDIDVPSAIEQRVRLWLNDLRRFPDRPLVAICPGAKKSACLWPLQNFLRLGEKLISQSQCEILVLGGAEHRTDAERLLSAWGCGIDGVGKFSVFETASALKQCAFMIGVDTGTTHLAAAVGISCLVVFSQRELSSAWEPMGEGHHIIRMPVPCQGCGLPVCNAPGHPCMTGIAVETVLERALQMLRGAPGENRNNPGLVTIAATRSTADLS